MAKQALGKGLDALLGGSEYDTGYGKADSSVSSNTSLPPGITDNNGDLLADISLLKPNPHQPRTEFDMNALQELCDSIRENGVIQPVLIEESGDGGYYIIAGERRTRAARMAGLTQIPVRIKRYSEERKLEVALIENIQRENLNPVEEAAAYRKLMELSNISQDDVAKRVGKNRSTVANALRLLKLPEDMRTSLANGDITAGHARALLSVANASDQRILFGRIVGSGLSVREAEQYAGEMNGAAKKAAPAKGKKNAQSSAEARDPQSVFLEQELIDKLGTKVAIKGSLSRGTIEIEYFSRDDLDRLYAIIMQ